MLYNKTECMPNIQQKRMYAQHMPYLFFPLCSVVRWPRPVWVHYIPNNWECNNWPNSGFDSIHDTGFTVRFCHDIFEEKKKKRKFDYQKITVHLFSFSISSSNIPFVKLRKYGFVSFLNNQLMFTNLCKGWKVKLLTKILLLLKVKNVDKLFVKNEKSLNVKQLPLFAFCWISVCFFCCSFFFVVVDSVFKINHTKACCMCVFL